MQIEGVVIIISHLLTIKAHILIKLNQMEGKKQMKKQLSEETFITFLIMLDSNTMP